MFVRYSTKAIDCNFYVKDLKIHSMHYISIVFTRNYLIFAVWHQTGKNKHNLCSFCFKLNVHKMQLLPGGSASWVITVWKRRMSTQLQSGVSMVTGGRHHNRWGKHWIPTSHSTSSFILPLASLKFKCSGLPSNGSRGHLTGDYFVFYLK